MTESLIRILDVMATNSADQIDLLVSRGFQGEPVEPEDGIAELVDDFFEEMVPMIDADEEWRKQLPQLSMLFDAFPDGWWREESINSISALQASPFWVKVRDLASDAQKEVAKSLR